MLLAVYWNASTRFTDGFEMGLGGELGISTQKLHVRGPVGLRELTSIRWVVNGAAKSEVEDQERKMKIGIIGLGQMGEAIVKGGMKGEYVIEGTTHSKESAAKLLKI